MRFFSNVSCFMAEYTIHTRFWDTKCDFIDDMSILTVFHWFWHIFSENADFSLKNHKTVTTGPNLLIK